MPDQSNESPTTEPDKGEEPPEAVLGRLRDTMDHFEQTHPDVTRVLGRVVDALSNMGI